MEINNPILKGFHPDPSILRVGDDYYIATSTFHWFPGVLIYHSRDLIHWELIARPLNRLSQLDMRGNPDSGGVWAPCLSYCDGLYYLVFTDVKSFTGVFKDTHNYLITAEDIRGEWSDPVYLNSSGFDPSLFHDEDGRKWLVNMSWDYRSGKNAFAGILLQEYSTEEKRLVGSSHIIYTGTELGLTEGPHLYRHDNYYYLLTAEGGTEFSHAVTVARSLNLFGPYKTDPNNPMLTSRNDFTLELKSAGHADLVETQDGEWYLVHLCRRPLPSCAKSILGRETAIQKIVWTSDGWPRLACGGNKPQTAVSIPDFPQTSIKSASNRDEFDSEILPFHYQTLRIPLAEDSLSLIERPGYLRLKGRESLSSLHTQSLVARRQQAFRCSASTCLEFKPESYKQMAGLIWIYDTSNFYYLVVSRDELIGKNISIISCDNGNVQFPVGNGIAVPEEIQIFLKAVMDFDMLTFFFSIDGRNWNPIGTRFNSSNLSDEHYEKIGHIHFTGTFVGMCCQDLSGTRKEADFDWFEYAELE